MPRPKRSEAEIAEMRERILDAARDILVTEGADSISIRAIAERVGVSHMVLYSYFENREALLRALRERQRERMRDRHEATLREAQEGDVREVVRRVLAFYAGMARRHSRVYELLWVQPIQPIEETADGASPCPFGCPDSMGKPAATDEELQHRHEGFVMHLQHLAHLVELGIDQGAFVARDPLQAAATVVGIVNSPLILFYGGRLTDADLRDRMAADCIEIAMSYLTGSACTVPDDAYVAAAAPEESA